MVRYQTRVSVIAIVKYGFKVCVVSFDSYSIHFKVYIHLPFIKTQRQTTVPFDSTHFISSSNRQTPRLYQGSADCCEEDRNSNIIFLLQKSQTIQYFNQSVLAISPDLNIFVWSIMIFDLIFEAPLYRSFLLRASYLYNSTWTKVLQFWFVNRLTSLWLPLSKVCSLYCYYGSMVLRSVRYHYVPIKYGYTVNFFFHG